MEYIYILAIPVTLVVAWLVYKFFIKKDPWDIAQANSPIDVPKELPTLGYSAKRVRVYYGGLVPREVYDAIDDAITELLWVTNQDIPTLNPKDIWKKWDKFNNHSDFNVLLLNPTYQSQDPNYLGCNLLTMKSGQTVAGTVIGLKNKSGKIEGTPFIVCAIPQPEDNCMNLFRLAVKHEGEHVRLINSPELFFFYQGARDIHPIFPAPDAGRGFLSTEQVNTPCGFSI